MIEIVICVAIWVAIIICTEAITEIIVSSDLLFDVRDKLSQLPGALGKLVGKLVNCGYCASVWIAFGLSWAIPGRITKLWYIDIVIKTFVVHRLSNAFHELIKRWLDRIPLTLIIHKVKDERRHQGIRKSQR